MRYIYMRYIYMRHSIIPMPESSFFFIKQQYIFLARALKFYIFYLVFFPFPRG